MADGRLPVRRVALDDPGVGVVMADELRHRLSALPDALLGPLIEPQLASKKRTLAVQHPDAVVDLVTIDDEPVAYLVTDTADGVIRLCDIAVIGSSRGQGYGRALLAALTEVADASDEAIELSVWHDAPARSWYERHGFRTVGGDRDGYLEMRREPAGE